MAPMPELPTILSAQLRRMVLLLVGTLPLCILPVCALAQAAVPAELRACAAEANSARRLACYDREIARLSATPARTRQPSTGPAPAGSDLPASAVTQSPHAAPAASAPPTVANREPATQHHTSRWRFLTGGASSRLTAHISRLDRWPNAMVLHLDNGQVWQQTGRASGDLSLHVGDSVTIEKHLGSYWLSSRYVSDMQVRLKPQ